MTIGDYYRVLGLTPSASIDELNDHALKVHGFN